MKKEFHPTEIIFAITDICNLNCPHCFVTRKKQILDSKKACKFLETCSKEQIQKIGFSGGEPFLYCDAIIEICKKAIELDFMFDRIMTNGIWWNSELELDTKLNNLYEIGFDGKFGLSLDSFHNQPINKIITFCKKIYQLWNNPYVIEIQSVISQDKLSQDYNVFKELAKRLNAEINYSINKKTGIGFAVISNEKLYLPIQRTPQSFQSNNLQCWQSKKWFKDDFCEGPGQLLYVHPNGNIAPCCGFANEENELKIGTINENFYEILENANKNFMVNICYKTGLNKYRKELKKKKHIFPGKTKDICTFCEYICKINEKSI